MRYTNSIADVPSEVAGIPCIVAVTYYDCGYDDGGKFLTGIDWVLCDRKGYKAAWLEKKLTVKEESRINDEVINYMERSNECF
jgi:hypothetical protein